MTERLTADELTKECDSNAKGIQLLAHIDVTFDAYKTPGKLREQNAALHKYVTELIDKNAALLRELSALRERLGTFTALHDLEGRSRSLASIDMYRMLNKADEAVATANKQTAALVTALEDACDWLKRLQEEYDPTDTEDGIEDIERLRRGERPTALASVGGDA